MDARTIYNLMKPHLNRLNVSEKRTLSQLITKLPPNKVSCHHRKVISLSKAKEKLKLMCSREMEREKQEKKMTLS
ncbi:hypothetical protein SAMN04488034_102213 [Salinimicrobium catena]|uniref:Uncharacterized protein n=1 Tax=Salinimicrobium catena TaxID=390640 RepID=A0A1H5LB28_9FLAO|nr:hypothetical protein [Salinimicrobium catena]SDL07962.1 hypothetical protein SAMN04488140_102213 [Salinimicrobium catena]SEE74252.1 hypothetical protein SAMN04488034_102213 [Salinimicrobium catena]